VLLSLQGVAIIGGQVLLRQVTFLVLLAEVHPLRRLLLSMVLVLDNVPVLRFLLLRNPL